MEKLRPIYFEKIQILQATLSLLPEKIRLLYGKIGQTSLIITRFPLSGLGPPMNFLTGLTGYGYGRFLVAIVPGEFLWTAFNLGLGYWFGDAWEIVGNTVNQYMLWILSVSALIFVLWLLIRTIQKHNHSKTPKIAVEE